MRRENMATKVINARLQAAKTGTDWLPVIPGTYSVSVQGGFAGQVTLQRSFDGGQSIEDVEAFDGQFAGVREAAEEQLVRLYIQPGDYQSGAIACRLGQWRR
jgi:hypothetical protein